METSAGLQIDHVVILVNDLKAASADYSTLGFTVVQGGEHADGLTHNALVSFADGSYLELVAFKGNAPESHFFYRGEEYEGLVTYALLPDDINRVISAVRQRGLELAGPIPGGRLRPDGTRIAWQTARPPTRDLPFLCADVTPRELRVPGGSATRHPNGIMGIAAITASVYDLRASVKRYSALLGVSPQMPDAIDSTSNTATFRLASTSLILAEPLDEQERARLAQLGEGPSSLSMRTQEGGITGPLSAERTHGVQLEALKRKT